MRERGYVCERERGYVCEGVCERVCVRGVCVRVLVYNVLSKCCYCSSNVMQVVDHEGPK